MGSHRMIDAVNSIQKSTIAAVIAFSGLAMPCLATAETETGDRPVINVPRGGGRVAYERHNCVTCHAPDGRGGQNEGGYGADLRVTPLTEEQIIVTIVAGRPSRGMPSFQGRMDDETLQTLARFIKQDLRLKQ